MEGADHAYLWGRVHGHNRTLAGLADRGSAIAADPLTGSVDYAGHQMSWSVGGASAAPSELADRYDGVVQAGSTVTFTGSMTLSLGPRSATNLSQYASLSGAQGVSFSQRVGEGPTRRPSR